MGITLSSTIHTSPTIISINSHFLISPSSTKGIVLYMKSPKNINENFTPKDEILTGESLQSKLQFEKSPPEVFIKYLVGYFGTLAFLILNVVIIILWILLNTGTLPIFPIFDPYPFNLLIMLVSLFAILLSIIVLISQNRQGRITEIRQQVDLEINVRTEQEVTKILELLDSLHVELGIKKKDHELEEMKEKIDLEEIKEEIEEVLEEEVKLS